MLEASERRFSKNEERDHMKKLIVLVGAACLALLALPKLSAADHAAVGADKCAKMCHKVQFESWARASMRQPRPRSTVRPATATVRTT